MVNYADVGPDVKVTTSIVAGSMLFPTWNPIHPGLFLKIVAVTPCSLEVSWGQGTTASGTKLPRRWREQMMRPPKSLWLEKMLQFHGICQASWCPKTPNHMVVLMRESYLSTQGFFLPVITSSPHSQDPSTWPVCEEIPWHQVGLGPRDLHSDIIPWLNFFRNPRPLVERVLDDHFPPEPSAESFAVTKKVPKT